MVLVGLQLTVSGNDKPTHTVVGKHLSDHYNDFMRIMREHNSSPNILEDVVTVFVSPTESYRKMKFMPVLSTEGQPLQNDIVNFKGTAVQYSAVFEVGYFEQLMKGSIDGIR